MARRLNLQNEFIQILGTQNVYFQPPASVKLKYPCIVYKIASRDTIKADDMSYAGYVRYEVTLICRDPDSEIPEKLLRHFRYISHVRNYPSDNLHHDVFTLYY